MHSQYYLFEFVRQELEEPTGECGATHGRNEESITSHAKQGTRRPDVQDTNPAFMENAKSQKLKVPTNRNRDCQESPRMGQCPSKRCHGRCHHCNTNEVLPEDAAGSRTNRSHKSSPSRGPLRSQSRSTNCGLPNSTTSSSNQRQVLWRVNECPSGQSLNTRIIKVANFKPTSITGESNALRVEPRRVKDM